VFILVLKRHCSISFLRFKQPIIISNSVFIFLDTWIASLGQSEQTATCHVSRRLSVISERWLRSSLTRGLSVKPSQRDSSGPHQLHVKAHLLISLSEVVELFTNKQLICFLSHPRVTEWEFVESSFEIWVRYLSRRGLSAESFRRDGWDSHQQEAHLLIYLGKINKPEQEDLLNHLIDGKDPAKEVVLI
jgi:hypothetical protein